MVDETKDVPRPGQDERGSRYGQDLPGAARGDRQKFKDMINAGQGKRPIVPKSYPGAEPPRGYGVVKDDSGSAALNETKSSPADGMSPITSQKDIHRINQEKPAEIDLAYSNPWGNQRANRSATIMGGNPESGRTRNGEGPVWVAIDEKDGSEKANVRPEALDEKHRTAPDVLPEANDPNLGEQGWRSLGEKHGTAPDDNSPLRQQPSPAQQTPRADDDNKK